MKLKLHEAIAVVLLDKKFKNRTATIEDITYEINKRELYIQKQGTPTHSGQIRLRTHPNTKSGKFYNYLFEFIEPDKIKLK